MLGTKTFKFRKAEEQTRRTDSVGKALWLVCQAAQLLPSSTAPPITGKRNSQPPGLLAAEEEEADTLLEPAVLWPLALLSPPSLTMDLSKIPARDLDKFIENYLLPDTRFREEVRQAINIICAFLKEMCFLQAADPVRVSKVVKVSPPAGPGIGWGGG